MSLTLFLVCFFKQKTAYEMRISDWSSDVCSSDLMKDDEWDQVIRVNLEAAFRLARAATRPMMKARFGRIISITSVVGQTGNPGQVNYAASKAGLVGMSKALAQELASRNLTVNCVAAGFIRSAMTDFLPGAPQESLPGAILAGRP